MPIDALVRPLLNVPLFQGLKPLQLTEIARRADRIVYKPGDVIVTAHGEPDAAVLVVSGEAVRTEGPGLDAGRRDAIPAGALISDHFGAPVGSSTSTSLATRRGQASATTCGSTWARSGYPAARTSRL